MAINPVPNPNPNPIALPPVPLRRQLTTDKYNSILEVGTIIHAQDGLENLTPTQHEQIYQLATQRFSQPPAQ